MNHKFNYKWTLKDATFTKDKGTVFSCFAGGGGSTLLAAANLARRAYGFEIKKDFYKKATAKVLPCIQRNLFV